ncbi:hypothetical protein G7Z17_g8709 [Cylindrodendrum hubeiense]|uniref:ubiquitinyl hydrolase 1 n=1 Tax=Cylindrodendrum hubeiense TaxID=595255 RepID=A0A9P5H5Y9_9HYPO|nr:hypothetical protein G7Z17_g8709 [Cylindrodendrum hubeiense]
MFQPQPTPFTSSCFAAYGVAPELDFGFPVSAGGGGAGAPAGPPYDSQPQQQTGAPPQEQQQHHHQHHQHHQNPHLQRQQQASASPAASPYAQSTTSTTSPPPQTPTNRDTAQAHHQHQHQQLQLRQQQQQHQQQQQQQQQQYQQLSHQHQISQHQHHQPRQAPHQPSHQPYPRSVVIIPKMEDQQGQQGQQGQHDIAAQQAAAKDYQAVLKASRNRLAPWTLGRQQIVKRGHHQRALPQTFSHYRPIQGDGNCGWRAIGFSYFEKLIDSGDQGKIEGEVARLMSMSQMMSTVGGYAYFEEWADEMFGLLREIAQSMDNPNPQVAHLLLLERWNDSAISSSIIYYLRLLAATYLKANAATYDPFLLEVAGGVIGYCSQSIELVDREIEHLGIVALAHMLLQPVNFVLEIVYLDRSPGSQANRYRLPEEANGQDPSNLGPIIYLLYRPDHYDILYLTPPRLELPLPVPTAPVSMPVNRVNSLSQHTRIESTQMDLGEYSSVDFSALSIIPGLNPMGMAPLAPLHPPPSSVQHSPWMSQFSDGLPALNPTVSASATTLHHGITATPIPAHLYVSQLKHRA